MIIKKIALAAAATIGLSSAALAADMRMPAKAPPPMVSPAINWSGFYIGVMGGYGVSDEISVAIPGVVGVTVSSSDLSGGFVGGTIGYNWQMPGSQFVFGIEVDGAWSDIKHSENLGLGITFEDRIEGLGSVTGRLGMAFNTLLLYAKGGFAWGINEMSLTNGLVTISESQDSYRLDCRRRSRMDVCAELDAQGRVHVRRPERCKLRRGVSASRPRHWRYAPHRQGRRELQVLIVTDRAR